MSNSLKSPLLHTYDFQFLNQAERVVEKTKTVVPNRAQLPIFLGTMGTMGAAVLGGFPVFQGPPLHYGDHPGYPSPHPNMVTFIAALEASSISDKYTKTGLPNVPILCPA